ncbi:MAG TPA: NAD(P)H-hydrate dehydratase [Candidatus Acidoferrales bacterium]|nr:NAD(P)H-hydrate dehydratase [Candidatus Acidoferrales bacterium]
MKILTVDEMRAADRLTTERYAIPSLALMENAGSAITRFIAAHFSPLKRRRVVVLCGKGNNGGDGFVVARKLRELGGQPIVLLFADPSELTGDAAENFRRLHTASIETAVIRDATAWGQARNSLADAAVIVDALFGTGLRGSVEGLLAQVIQDVNAHEHRTCIVSVDIPSGLLGDTGEVAGPAVVADYTITFTAPKVGMIAASARPWIGRLTVADIGSPRALIEEISQSNVRWLEPWEFRSLPTGRKADSNKGLYGHALIVAGSTGKAGAAALAAMGALRVGAGLVTVATPEPVLRTVAGFAPEIMTEPLHATAAGTIARDVFDSGGFAKILDGKTVLALGPGLTTQAETQQFVRSIITSPRQIPIILDADGLNAFAGRADELRGPRETLAVTPHPGEMARLISSTVKDVQSRRLEVARKAASDWQAFVILKGYQTILAAPDGTAWINSTGNPGMSTGGTGDVLTGMLAGITAQLGAQNWPLALACGVYLHGLAGDLAAEEFGEAPLIATDVIRAIPNACAQLRDAIQAL